MQLNKQFKPEKNQTLSESQFALLKTLNDEYTQGFLALNSMGDLLVTFYGGHKVQPNDESYKMVYDTAKMFAKKGWGVVSGGGPGIMEASLKGSLDEKGKAIALKIDIKGEPDTLDASMTLTFTQFSVRKFLLRQSDAFVIAEGGFGTLDELMELLTLIKTDKYPRKPIFLLGTKFWEGYINWFNEVLLNEYGTISQEFINLFQLVDSAEEIEKYMFNQK